MPNPWGAGRLLTTGPLLNLSNDGRRAPIFPPNWASTWAADEHGEIAGFDIAGVLCRLRWIPAGRFVMGSPEDEHERRDDEKEHEVVLSHGYWLGETACTQGLWQAVMGQNPSHFKGYDRPVDNVSYEDIEEFLAQLNGQVSGLVARLPTESEWEYGCRAGTKTAFSFGDDITPEQVNHDGTYPYWEGAEGKYREETVVVKNLPFNNWGFYEMHGNVREWCSDWYGEYGGGVVTNPAGPRSGEERVLRGGAWTSFASRARSALRSSHLPSVRRDYVGFRLARGW